MVDCVCERGDALERRVYQWAVSAVWAWKHHRVVQVKHPDPALGLVEFDR